MGLQQLCSTAGVKLYLVWPTQLQQNRSTICSTTGNNSTLFGLQNCNNFAAQRELILPYRLTRLQHDQQQFCSTSGNHSALFGQQNCNNFVAQQKLILPYRLTRLQQNQQQFCSTSGNNYLIRLAELQQFCSTAGVNSTLSANKIAT